MVSQWYYLRVGGNPNGPFSARKIRQLASAGQLLPDDRLCLDGNPKVVRAGNIEGLSPPTSPATVSPAGH